MSIINIKKFLLVLIILCLYLPSFSFQDRPRGRRLNPTTVPALGGLADDGLAHVPPNYNSGFTVPNLGETYVDSMFGTTIRKVTDYDTANESFSQEYAPHSAWNVNNTYLLVIGTSGGGYKVINPTTGALIQSLGISSSAECYWSVTDPEVIYYHSSNLLKKYTVNTNTHSTVATFNGSGGLPNCTSITFGGGDVDVSEDGDHIPIFCQGSSYGLYKFSTNEVTPTFLDFSTSDQDVLWCAATPDNNVLCRLNTTRTHPFDAMSNPNGAKGTVAITNGSPTVIGTSTEFLNQLTKGGYIVVSGQRKYITDIASNTSLTVDSNFTAATASGLAYTYSARMILYDKNMNFIRAIAPFGGHASSGRYTDGSEILLIDGANDPVGGVCASNGIYRIKLDGTGSGCALAFPDFNLTGHLSFSNHRGHDYALASYYDGRLVLATGTALLPDIVRSDALDAGVWKKYYNEIILFKTDGSEVRRMAHSRIGLPGFSTTDSYYWPTNRANLSKTLSNRGYPNQFIFASNMRQDLRHRNLTGTFSTTSGNNTITGVGSNLSGISGEATVGGEFTINGETKIIATIVSDTSATTTTNFSNTNSGVTATSWFPDSGIEAFVGTIDSLTPSDFTAPTQSSISSGTPGSTTATITWTNSESATCQVEYGTTTYYGSGISTFSKTTTTSCSINLTGLLSNTTYHYRVKSRDIAGNIKLSSDQTFTTAP